MPTTNNAKKTRSKKSRSAEPATAGKAALPPLGKRTVLILSLGLGAILGLSAPGWEQWYLAWFALAPLFLLTFAARHVLDAWLRALAFGFGYSLMWFTWLIDLHPLNWLGFSDWQSRLMADTAWVAVSLHQALIIAATCSVIRLVPLTGGFLPRAVEGSWKLPALLVVPLLWVLLENKVLNAPDLLGVPWPMIEYSQYRQLPILQISSVIGGVGLGALVVMVNTAIAGLVATFSERLSLKSLASHTRAAAAAHCLAVGFIVVSCLAFGFARMNGARIEPIESLSVVQGNINIEMQKTRRRYTLSELVDHYSSLVSSTPPGLVVWTESALPAYLKKEGELQTILSDMSRSGRRDMIIGSMDRDHDGNPFNAAFGIDASGRLADVVYHKRYLVPFGEYMPAVFQGMPSWFHRLTNTPAGGGFSSGKFPVVLNLSGKPVAPLICFETMSPELVVRSVRNGGRLLVNLSDLAWFHDSSVGDQMVAFSVLRAVETDRFFVFAANTGPSVIVDPLGRINAASPRAQESVLKGKVELRSGRTPFVCWFL